MVAFDATYIPALAQTNAAQQGAAAVPRAQAALARLQSQWPALRARLAADARPHWATTLAQVQRQIERAAAAAGRQDWAAAHEALEPVRQALRDARLRDAMDYLPDHLTAFHDVMEALAEAGAAQGPLSAAQRQTLARDFAKARALWREVERRPLDPAMHPLGPAQLAQWQRGLADEAAALSALSAALNSPDDTALRRAAAGIKPPFSRAYTALGQPLDKP